MDGIKLAAFDLEIYKVLPEGETDWQAHRPLGISCAAIYYRPENSIDGHTTTHIYAPCGDEEAITANRQMTQEECRQIVYELQKLVAKGYMIVTVNGLAFDFSILAEESGLYPECGRLALYNCDLLFMSVCRFGWRVGLDALARGAKVMPKLHNLVLSTGEMITDMNGARAPQLWQDGEFEAVLAYLQEDVRATLEVAEKAMERGRLSWMSQKGREWVIPVNGSLPNVATCLTWPRPDTSWMTDPPSQESYLSWIQVSELQKARDKHSVEKVKELAGY